MLKNVNKLREKVQSISNFERFKSLLFKIEIQSWNITQYVDKCIVEKISMSKKIILDDIFEDSDDKLFIAGSGLHLCQFKSCRGVLEISLPIKTGDMMKSTVYVLPWDRKKILDEFKSVLPVRDNWSRLEVRNKKHHHISPLNPDFGNQEQFVTNEVYSSIDDVFQSMLAGKENYTLAGKPFKETILLYGPPGTGKSSIIRHFAAKYNLNITKCDPDMILDLFVNARSTAKPEVVVIEDFDSAEFLCKEKSSSVLTENALDYSDFINWLDGIQPLNNVIIFLTTNCIEKIIESVVRGGRVNRKILMPLLTVDQICSFFDQKWHNKIRSYANGDITIAMIPDLRNAKDENDFDNLVKILS